MASVFTVTSLSLLIAEVRAESNCVEQSAVLFKSSRSLCGVETFSLCIEAEKYCVCCRHSCCYVAVSVSEHIQL
jgi:hypothetical protein